MKTRIWIVNSILWAAAIIAAAIEKAPSFFVLELLPVLAISSSLALNVIVQRPTKIALI
jgi:hypothetical protein